MASGAADTVLDCTFEGSGNLYGLGIRLSIYIQYFITSLAYNYNQACFNSISTGNSILRVALLIGVTYAIATGEVTVNIDAAITTLLISLIIADMPDAWFNPVHLPRRFSHPEFRAFIHSSRVWRLAFQQIWLLAYSIWFWQYGVNKKLHPANPDCGKERIWVVVPVDLDSNALRIFVVVFLSLQIVVFAVFMLEYLRPAAREEATQEKLENGWIARRVKRFVGWTARYGVTRRVWNNVLGVAALVVGVLAVELPIRWNNVTGVNSVAEADQLIALLVAVANVYMLWLDWGEEMVIVKSGKKDDGGKTENEEGEVRVLADKTTQEVEERMGEDEKGNLAVKTQVEDAENENRRPGSSRFRRSLNGWGAPEHIV